MTQTKAQRSLSALKAARTRKRNAKIIAEAQDKPAKRTVAKKPAKRTVAKKPAKRTVAKKIVTKSKGRKR
tara:strand:+ start:305 stop:514 length:210 start_codon:yes stop_codon:yes gene_type:complete